jgi:hypothetical protein
MTQTKQNAAARRRGELNRDRGSRRLAPAIEARRRLNTLKANSTTTQPDRFGPSDPRHAYLTQAHD